MFRWLLRLLPRLLDTVPADELDGVILDTSVPYWEITCPRKGLLPEFLESLESLLPDESILYLEGGYLSKKDETLLNRMSVPEQAHIAVGTIWPRPKIFHVPATAENLGELAQLAQHRALPEIAIHIHVYKDDEVLLQWHDAFDSPIYLAREIPDEKVKEFCQGLNVEYRLTGKSEGVRAGEIK
jgi:hypothetical protein